MSEYSNIHKAEPHDTGRKWVCVHCGQNVHRVMGGQGPTWVHSDTGAVVARNPVK